MFTSERAGARNLFWQTADGTGAIERLTESPNTQNPGAVSPDGTRVIFTETAPKTGVDVMQVQLDGTRRVTPLVQTPFGEQNGIVSPDGRWLAYEANDSGQFEMYVRPFPEVNSGHWQVSTGGGTRPLWARNGAGAFLRVARGCAHARRRGARPVVGGHHTHDRAQGRLFHGPGRESRPHIRHLARWPAVPDDQAGGGSDQTASPTSLIVVQHFDEELKRLVPTN